MAKKTSATKLASKRRSTNVPDSYRGFSLQATRFLYYLLKVEQNDIVSLEYFEDVGVEKSDGTKVAEQDKSYRSSNPLTDRSVAFWKALRNWVEAALIGTLPPGKSHFIAFTPNARMGDIVTTFHNAKSIEDAKKALGKAREELSGDDGWDVSDAAAQHVDVVFNADVDLVAGIIARFSVDATDQSPEDALKPLLHERLVGEDSFTLVVTWGHGWVKRMIDRFVERGQSPRIVKKDFHEPLLNFVRTHDRINILRSVAGTPATGDVALELAVRDYVKQLRVIDLDDIDVLEAVNDYLSASVDRTTWSDQGMISEESLDTFEKELKTTWRNKRRRTTLGFAQKDEKHQGQVTYTDCMEHEARVDGLETPRHFVRGSWHAMADDLTIGWHPQYKIVLSALDSITEATTEGG